MGAPVKSRAGMTLEEAYGKSQAELKRQYNIDSGIGGGDKAALEADYGDFGLTELLELCSEYGLYFTFEAEPYATGEVGEGLNLYRVSVVIGSDAYEVAAEMTNVFYAEP